MKGISPLIAAVLLISVTVAIGLVVSLFYTTFTKTTTTSVSSGGQGLISCSDSYPTVTLVRYPASGSGMMNVSFFNPGNDALTNITIYALMSNSSVVVTTFPTWYLNPLTSNSTQLFDISGFGTPAEVKVVGVCSGRSVAGSCLAGQSCMKAV